MESKKLKRLLPLMHTCQKRIKRNMSKITDNMNVGNIDNAIQMLNRYAKEASLNR